MSDWSWIGSLLDFCAVYYTTQLVRCAAFSFLLLGLVMQLRKMLFSRRTFIRGLLWSSFLLIPFLGKLKLFYENAAVLRMTWWVTHGTMTCLWADRIYMVGVFVATICIFGKRLCLQKSVAEMEKVSQYNTVVSVTDMNVTPFTVGLFAPKIVIPKVMLENYSHDELKSVIQHERTHIRLGHLWFGLAWDVLRCLLWVNPFLTVCQKQFRADMEDICDRVCIQNSGRAAHEYGMVLLKTLKLLRSGTEGTPPAVTYAGEMGFADMKRRMGEIAGFRPYRKRMCMGAAAIASLVIIIMLLAVYSHSYARYSNDENILVYEYADGQSTVISNNDSSIQQMISYDDSYVYVDSEAFEDFLEENNAEGEVWIVFGGFYKLPGLTGMAESCIYENNSEDEVVRIPYESITDDWYFGLLKML
ncbi:M48 family metalloprotease [Lachnospiraceae bacterium WCA-9-b2]|uniref:M48 family metalloprotease n=1 Tax=Sporofaciens musculi TaxID=2681861 RepID=A0A7X3MJ40_9FIRM|nr:M56 family metallopeptidase [Sporofaciens musculi]MXP77355.1 M48 family metalloprotease [Sporofaciens musculi]